jgi:hypothetical protein
VLGQWLCHVLLRLEKELLPEFIKPTDIPSVINIYLCNVNL